MKAEFEEKSFEAAFNAELERGNPWRTFSPGQVAEAFLGVDVLARLAPRHPFWAAVNLHHRSGHRNARRGVPKELFNVFLQYKRSEHVVGHNGMHYAHFRGDYYRFKVSFPLGQLRTLQRLESAVGGAGHVLYVAPEFASLSALRSAQATRQVIARSVTVLPSAFGAHHRAFNFRNGSGLLNPEPEWVEAGVASRAFERPQSAPADSSFTSLVSDVLAKMENEMPDRAMWSGVAREVDAALTRTDAPVGAFEFLMLAGITWSYGTQWLAVEDRRTQEAQR